MNRLQKKCLIVVSGVHVLLLLVLAVGPAFMPSSKPVELPIIEFIPVVTTDKMISGGGDPTVKSPPAEAITPPVRPLVRPTPAPTPVRPVVQPAKPVEPAKPGIRVSQKVITRPSTQTRPSAETRPADTTRQIEAVNQVLAGIRGGVAGSTEIRLAAPLSVSRHSPTPS
jgi:hypothetical protein